MKKSSPKGAADGQPGGAALQAAEFTTNGLPGPDQFDAFKATYRGVIEVFPARSSDKTFPVSQKVWNLDRMTLVCVQLPGPGHAFGWRHVRRIEFDHYYALVPFDDAAPEVPEGRARALGLHCLARPFQSELEAHGMLMLFVPCDLVAIDIDAALDRKLADGASLLLADFLTLLCRRLPRLRRAELPGVLEALRGLIAACAAPYAIASSNTRNPTDLRLLNRARRLIERRIAEPDLSPVSLCRDLSVSRSRLYRTFEPFGGVSAHIRRQRLLGARDALLDGGNTHSVARIAELWGFADASTFSRVFKNEFGLSPGAARKAGWAEHGHRRETNEPQDRAHGSSLHALLRRLQR